MVTDGRDRGFICDTEAELQNAFALVWHCCAKRCKATAQSCGDGMAFIAHEQVWGFLENTHAAEALNRDTRQHVIAQRRAIYQAARGKGAAKRTAMQASPKSTGLSPRPPAGPPPMEDIKPAPERKDDEDQLGQVVQALVATKGQDIREFFQHVLQGVAKS